MNASAKAGKGVVAYGWFTLIELLVVIAIIAILASLMLPALHGTKDKAKQVVCISNLKNVGVAFMCYVGDYNGNTFNDVGPDGTDNWSNWGGADFPGYINPYGGMLLPKDRPLSPYLGQNWDIYKCPNDNPSNPIGSGNSALWEYYGTTYIGNEDSLYSHNQNVASVRYPSRLMLIGEMTMYIVKVPSWRGYGGRFTFHDPSGWRSVVLFYDGHAAFITIDKPLNNDEYEWYED